MATPGPADAGQLPRTDRLDPLAAGGPPGLEGRFVTLFTVGRGGMGTVEVALERGPGGFERIVALKRLLPEGARDPRRREMFLREAQLAALLVHPNVVHAYAFGEIREELFLVMEYVEGEPLSRLLSASLERGERLDPALVAWVLAEVCDGLHAAHELRGGDGRPLHVVHRDVSPHNVMIAFGGHAKILDFGVAKFELSAGGSQTRTGEVKGKMAYMSPEQALGEKVDRRTDLFSVGTVLFECIAGRKMWGAGTDLDVMRKLALEEPPRLDDAVADAPRSLVELHARLVDRDPDKRPSTAREVAERLRSIAASAELRSSSGNAEAVRALMQGLFSVEESGRRAQLTEALERVAPSNADSLRRSLDPAAAAAAAHEWRTGHEPAPLARSARGPRRPMAAWTGAALILVAGGGAAVLGRTKDRETTPAHAAASAPAPASAPAATPAAGTPTAPVAAEAPEPTGAPSRAPAPLPVSATPNPVTGTKATPRARTPRPPVKPPDVDPSPF
jgi:serine/threonine-protein kinase